MQIVAVPLFNQSMVEEAYIFRELKENLLISTLHTYNLFDGATYCESLSILARVGLETFTLGKPIFVPIREINLVGNLPAQCREPANKVIFVLDAPLSNPDRHFPFIQQLRGQGYRFAINYPMPFVQNDPVLQAGSYLLLPQNDERRKETSKALWYSGKYYRNLTPIAVQIQSQARLESLYDKGYGLYESKVYKPTGRSAQVGPLKVNAIRLLNTIQNENFDFEEVSQIVRGDPALTVSLLKLVNTSSRLRGKISSIQQAVARIGQREVRKWVTTAVSRTLGSDRPSEMTRISLIRAKFAENLAPIFNLAHLAGELFLTGLFSVLDSILDLPMKEALGQVTVTYDVRAALLDGTGIYANVIQFVRDYENAMWAEVCRQMIIMDINEDELAEAYLNALIWYRDLVTEETEPPSQPEESNEPEEET